MKPFADDLLAQATRLLGAKVPQEILTLTCREAQRLAKVELLFGSFGTSANWAMGLHQRFRDSRRTDVQPAQRSALFGAHRAASRQRGPVELGRAEAATIVDTLCESGDPERRVMVFPIVHRQGRLCGSLALCLRSPLSDEATGLVVELSGLAALALDNVQRISAARRDRERLSLLAEAAEEGLWDWSPETGEFWWGGGVQTLIGDVVVQSRLSWKFEQMHPGDQERVRQSFEHALATPDAETWREEYRLRGTDSSWIRVEDHAHILRDSSGRAHRMVGALRDVTELRALFALEHAARAEAERANLAKDDFLAMLGHELRNPLSAILSALELLRRKAGTETFEKGVSILDRQARHLTRLVDDLLDVARIGQGKVHLERERIDLAEVMEVALERANPLIEEQNHRVDARITRALWIDADRGRMEQVIGNLLTNAAKYTPPGGRIMVEARATEGFAQVRIADTGIGISPEMLPRVFDRFAQDRQALDQSRGGLGLGLAIVRNLVQLHKGTVEVRSEGEGQGAEFVVRIPGASPKPGNAEAATPVDVASVNRRRVLVVDDNQDAAECVAIGLAEMGHETRVVCDGPAALSVIAEFDPQVVLLDLGLPSMDGYEVARRLREWRAGRLPRLVAVTGYGQDNDRRKTREAGFDVHLVKPVPFELLHEAIVGTAV